ncbi:SDA1 homolog [Paramuricea clavata]|uniref:SDA1 homolog n=1 Tax=Paramuricea clavata TaxID=317549 RepID=A0A6S7GAG4_PARCT|nr:SDA1 homolog [Paramuricea clavata]
MNVDDDVSSEDEWNDIQTNSEDNDDVIDETEENTPADNHSVCEENEENPELVASRISQTKIFTNEDFKKIKLTKIIQQVNPKGGKKRKREQTIDEPSEKKDLLSVDDIEQITGKKRRSNKEERIASAKVEIAFILIKNI